MIKCRLFFANSVTALSRSRHHHHGFSLIEIMVVVAIIAILATLALPSNEGKINRVKIQETLKLLDPYKPHVSAYYSIHSEFPIDNESAGMPEPQEMIGNYLESVYLIDGAMHLTLGKKINEKIVGAVISIRPIFVPGVENAPISWVCGYAKAPEGMIAAGDNKTSLEKKYLPADCW